MLELPNIPKFPSLYPLDFDILILKTCDPFKSCDGFFRPPKPKILIIKSENQFFLILRNFVVKNLCDKVSKFKNLRWQFRRIFRWLCHGVLHFFCRLNFHGEIYRTKWSLLRRKISVIKFQKSKLWDESFVGFSAGFVMV